LDYLLPLGTGSSTEVLANHLTAATGSHPTEVRFGETNRIGIAS